jgi:hypothetical protein
MLQRRDAVVIEASGDARWIDGSSAKGRVSVSGRADGIWTATRKE